MTRVNFNKYSNAVPSILGLLLLLGISFPALAQDNQDAEDDSVLEEVLVTSTASRLQSGMESPKPTTAIDKAQIDARGLTNIADVINELPSFVGSATPSSTTLNGAGTGGNFLNLRSLGSNRVLMLVDKRRWVSGATFGGVNLNTIPQMLIEQVEVVTGGASAQWGSDAVGGVINLRLARGLEGSKVEARYGATSHGDNKDKFAAFSFGSYFADDRGHFSFSLEYQDNGGIDAQGDRDWGREQWGIVGNPEDTGPNDGIPARLVVPNVQLGFGTPGGYLPAALGNHPAVSQIYFGPGGQILPYDIGEFPIPSAFAALPFQVGGSGGSLGLSTALLAPLERTAVMGLFDFELTENLNFFADLSWAESQTVNHVVQPWNFIGTGPDVISADNPFIPAELQQTMADNGIPVLIMGRTNEDHGFIMDDSTTETSRIALGLQGDMKDWSWEAYYTHGETDFVAISGQNPIAQNRLNAIDAVIDPISGEIVCRANAGGANGAPGCAPMNLFGDGSPSQASIDYISGTNVIPSKIEQDVIAVSMTGEAFQLPAGPLGFAFGLEYRKEKASTGYDDIAQAGGYFIRNGAPLSGKFDVKEAFFEVGVPVLHTANGMTLDLTGAVRYADYSTSGSAVPWQLGATFGATQNLTFRGTVSEDIRAPNISELFTAEALSFNNILNPATGEVGLTKIINGGNPNLQEEDASTITAGVVYQTSYDSGDLAVSLDWYRTEIEDAISQLPSQSIVNVCFEFNVGCENVEIVGDQIVSVNSVLFNIANRDVEGVDFEGIYSFNNVAGGGLSLRWLVSYFIENSFSPDGQQTFDDVGVVGLGALGGVPTPEWRSTLSADWVRGQFGMLGQIVYVDGGDLLTDQGPEDINDNSVSSQTIFNLSFRYDFDFSGDRILQLYAGIDNVFDQDPPVAPLDFVSNWGTNPYLYNVIGRSYYAGARFSF
jgi:iron complex outermembrane receptor protein